MFHRTQHTMPMIVAALAATIGAQSLAQVVAPVREAPHTGPRIEESPVVEIAICLDISGSMDGLINSARQKLWAIVNELALAKPTPRLRVALLTYGHTTHPRNEGWVKVETALTDDLDLVSERLFALSTNGGTELVARVMQRSLDDLDWTPSDDALKLIIVAGNESADQDQEMSFRDVARRAIGMGIMVNPIYCVWRGDSATVAEEWREIALLADGQYAQIDQDHGSVVIATPLDHQLIALSSMVNRTYIPFGEQGVWGSANQLAQDGNAVRMNVDAAAQRAATKGNALYFCSWDLVDSCRDPNFDIASVKDEDLPENMRGMTLEERRAYVEKMAAERAEIQKRIVDLNLQREHYVVAEQQRRAETEGTIGFDLAVRRAIREQASGKGLTFAELSQPGDDDAAPADQGADAKYLVQVNPHPRWQFWAMPHIADQLASEYGRFHGNIPSFSRNRMVFGDETYLATEQRLPDWLREMLPHLDQPTVIMIEEAFYTIHPKPTESGDANHPLQIDGQGQQQIIVPQTTRPLQQQQQQQQRQQRNGSPPQQEQQGGEAFIQRGTFWVDVAYIDEYDAMIGAGQYPVVDVRFRNTPGDRAAFLAQLTETQRKQADMIITRMLEQWGGGILVRINGRLVYLQFAC